MWRLRKSWSLKPPFILKSGELFNMSFYESIYGRHIALMDRLETDPNARDRFWDGIVHFQGRWDSLSVYQRIPRVAPPWCLDPEEAVQRWRRSHATSTISFASALWLVRWHTVRAWVPALSPCCVEHRVVERVYLSP